MTEKVPYTDTYCIEFNTEEMPGTIVATQIVISKRVMRKKDIARIDLCDHPLYSQLQEYVLNNPVRRGAKDES